MLWSSERIVVAVVVVLLYSFTADYRLLKFIRVDAVFSDDFAVSKSKTNQNQIIVFAVFRSSVKYGAYP